MRARLSFRASLQRACLLLCVAAASPAVLGADHRWYMEAAAGRSRASGDIVANRESTIVGASSIATDFDATDGAWKLGAGYEVLPWLRLEVNYADLGRDRLATRMLAGDPPASAAIDINRRVSGYGADAIASWPIFPALRIYGRVGAVRTRLEASASLSGNIVFSNGDASQRSRSVVSKETNLRFGAGARWALWGSGGLVAEWERYRDVGKAFATGGSGTTGESDIDTVWLGVFQSF